MDIKLRARLSAYSKIESISGVNNTLPSPDIISPGSVIGVSDKGTYVSISAVTHEDVDKLFTDVVNDSAVTKEEIDTLFEEENSNVSEEEIEAVPFSQIDTLFSNRR